MLKTCIIQFRVKIYINTMAHLILHHSTTCHCKLSTGKYAKRCSHNTQLSRVQMEKVAKVTKVDFFVGCGNLYSRVQLLHKAGESVLRFLFRLTLPMSSNQQQWHMLKTLILAAIASFLICTFNFTL